MIKRNKKGQFVKGSSMSGKMNSNWKGGISLEKDYQKKWWGENSELFKEIQTKHRYRKKEKLIKLKGGMCSKCGLKYNGKNACVFQFHHKEKGHKIEGGIGLCRRLEVLIKEIEKCDLVCANCHFLIHYKKYLKLKEKINETSPIT